MIYARSRRSLLRLAAATAALAIACTGAVAALELTQAASAWVAPLAGLAAGGLAIGGWLVWRARHLRSSQLCLFRDRLLVVQGRRATPVLWERIEAATLAVGGSTRWAFSGAEVRLGDTLTVELDSRRRVTMRPVEFGLEPAACRDLLLRYRDDPEARSRLPEFDSMLDLRGRPVQAGELKRSIH